MSPSQGSFMNLSSAGTTCCWSPRSLIADAADRHGANLELQRPNPDDLASGVSDPEMDVKFEPCRRVKPVG